MLDTVLPIVGGIVIGLIIGAVSVVMWMKRKAQKQMDEMMNNLSGAVDDE